MRSLRDVLDFLKAVKENGGSIGYMKACEITPKGVVLPSLIEMGLLWKGTGKDRFNYLDWTWHLTPMGEDLLELEKKAEALDRLDNSASCHLIKQAAEQYHLDWIQYYGDSGTKQDRSFWHDVAWRMPDVETPKTNTCKCGRMELIWSGWLDTTVKGGLGQPKTCKCPGCKEVCKYPKEANRA